MSPASPAELPEYRTPVPPEPVLGPDPEVVSSESAADPEGAATATHCIHCGLPLGRHHRPEDGPFCCNGCRTVYGLIHDEGLERFYDLKPGTTAPPADLRSDTFAWLEQLLQTAPALPGSTVRRLSLDVQGVHCAACVWLLEQLFSRHEAGLQLRINPALGTVDLAWDPQRGDLTDYLAEVERFGYRFGPPRKEPPRQSRRLLTRLGICVAVALNVMMFSLCYYLGLAPRDGLVYDLFGRLNLVLASVAICVGGWPFFTAAWHGVRRRVVHLDLPIAIGMLLAFAGSTYTYLSQGPEAAYFDTITIFVALMLVGRWLQERVLERNRNALLSSGGVADLYTRRCRDDEVRAISASEVRRGDELWIAPGDLAPAAGVLLHRPASVSLDWITGEADPLSCQPGETIPAGAFNAGKSGFRITATEDFSASRLNDLMRGSEAGDDTQQNRPGWWHRVSTVYVLAVLVLAAGGFIGWVGRDLRTAVEVAVAVLVVTCPCALGLAVPLGRDLINVALRRHGVLLRRDSLLDRALRVRRILFDKTGTLTRGQLALTEASRRTLLALPAEQRITLRHMTSRSNHPVSRCVAAALGLVNGGTAGADATGSPDRPITSEDPSPTSDAVEEVVGQGLRWRRGNVEYRFGRPDFALETAAKDDAPGEADRPRTVFSAAGQILARLEFQEELRRDAADEVGRLEAAGYRVYLLSGDTRAKVRAVASHLNLPPDRVYSELSPEQKAAVVKKLDRHDSLMVGDGLNDSLSFDAALCAATPAVDRAVLPQKADFYFLGDGIGAVRRVLQAADRLRRVQRDNLTFAALYNSVAVGLCLAGWVTPVVAAILMPLSSVTVVLLTSSRLGSRGASWMS
ncbi:MAG: heavy metal translocating P-type ATPase metal-binding domain-containing protein [bacterium]